MGITALEIITAGLASQGLFLWQMNLRKREKTVIRLDLNLGNSKEALERLKPLIDFYAELIARDLINNLQSEGGNKK